ncbi:MOV10 [Symbiodinium pilosum]|uniref:MOV10 protein n=1 Tax=Symbiodinium pilosum TaxID=2952 RepID=A0A812SRJ6_SYMPI|nr:MOV10 [Symbiodinium pilosum]
MPEDIIIVCPYNAQVVMIRSTLAADPTMRGIRTGSVDLFQGQEAAVALISLGASCGRLAFVLDPNRTNVALSRARALAVVVGSPALSECQVETVEELSLQSRYMNWLRQAFTQSTRTS